MSDSASEAQTLFSAANRSGTLSYYDFKRLPKTPDCQRVWHVGCPATNRKTKRRGGRLDQHHAQTKGTQR
jgi:hypothetical protein